MLEVKKRGDRYALEGHVGGQRVRLSLRTRSYDSAVRAKCKVERALVEGRRSELWPELTRILHPSTFRRLAALVGYSGEEKRNVATWKSLRRVFETHVQQLLTRGRLRESTWKRYQRALDTFSDFLRERDITDLKEIRRPIVEDFKAWRLARILTQKHARGGGGLDLDVAVLHRIFAYGVECELVDRNPVKMEGTPGSKPKHGSQPYTAKDLNSMRQAAGKDLLSFLLERHTGFRGSDAVDLRWREVDFLDNGLDRVTQKRGKQVWIPLHPELKFALEVEYQRRRPRPEEHVLLNPATGRPMTRSRLYSRIKALGRRAGVANAHPHRFRDTFAVDALLKGATPYDVAKMLGDTIETVEKHYAPFVPELRERARKIISGRGGLEDAGTNRAQSPDMESGSDWKEKRLVAGESISRILSAAPSR